MDRTFILTVDYGKPFEETIHGEKALIDRLNELRRDAQINDNPYFEVFVYENDIDVTNEFILLTDNDIAIKDDGFIVPFTFPSSMENTI